MSAVTLTRIKARVDALADCALALRSAELRLVRAVDDCDDESEADARGAMFEECDNIATELRKLRELLTRREAPRGAPRDLNA
jgi:hypothetical protein